METLSFKELKIILNWDQIQWGILDQKTAAERILEIFKHFKTLLKDFF